LITMVLVSVLATTHSSSTVLCQLNTRNICGKVWNVTLEIFAGKFGMSSQMVGEKAFVQNYV
jgi:hypothetical protein